MLPGIKKVLSLLTVFLIVVSFYFGTQSQKLQDTIGGGKDGQP